MKHLLLTIGALAVVLTWFFVPTPAAGSGETRLGHAQAPNLGWITVQPRRARVGDQVTLSGRTRGFVQFLPPFVMMQSAGRHTIHVTRRGLCGNTRIEPLAYAVVIRGGGMGGAGSRQSPRTGTPWKATFRVPPRMNQTSSGGRQITIRTQPGLYYLSAVGVGIDYCTLPRTSNQTVSVATITVVQ